MIVIENIILVIYLLNGVTAINKRERKVRIVRSRLKKKFLQNHYC